MSRIITKWKCKHCGARFDRYVSFGHPEQDFVWKWRCGWCGRVNRLLVKAMPRRRLFW